MSNRHMKDLIKEFRRRARGEGLDPAKINPELIGWAARRFDYEVEELVADWGITDDGVMVWDAVRETLEDPPPFDGRKSGHRSEEQTTREIHMSPPRHWLLYSAQVMRRYRLLQWQALDALGLRSPLQGWDMSRQTLREPTASDFVPLDNLPEVLFHLQEGETREGEHDVLWYPTRRSPRGFDTLSIRWGYWRSDTGGNVDYLDRVNGLTKLKDITRKLRSDTGLEEHEAVGFLLCDMPVVLPWLRVSIAWRETTGLSYTFFVGSEAVSAEALRVAYLTARKAMGRSQHSEGIQTSRARPPKRRETTYRLLEFVDRARSQGLQWPDIFKEWNRQAETRKYKTVAGMQRSFYKARREVTTEETGAVNHFTI